MRKTIFLFVIGILFSVLATAGGFQVGLQGQRQTGMGLLGTGYLKGPSSVFYNPGAMSFQENRFSTSIGMSPIVSTVSFQYEEPSLYEAKTDNPVSLPFSFYGSGKITEKLSAGLGVYTPYGSSTNWGDDWRGRHVIQDISLMSIYVQPTLSYQVSERFGFGVGFVYAYGQVELNKGFPLQDANGEEGGINLDGNSSGFGFNAGFYAQPVDRMEIGVTYRSEVLMEVENGDAAFSVPTSLAESFPPENKFDAELPLPASVNFGASYQFNDKFKLGVDVNYVFWSSYESLDFDFKENTESLEDLSQPKNYENGFIYRIGGEYFVNDMWTVRAGFYYDSPVADDEYYAPETPDAVKLGYTGGLSFAPNENLSIDASILFVQGLERTADYKPENFGGTYKYNAIVPGLGINYHF